MRTLWRRAGRLVRAEEGTTLILAIIVVMVVSITTVGIVSLVTSTQTTSSNERQGARAFTAGEAGLDLGANAVLTAWNGSPTLPADGQTINGSTTVDGNTVNWTATYAAGASSAPGLWKVTAHTVSPNGKVSRILQTSLEPSGSTSPGTTSAVYSYGFVAGGPATPSATSAVCTANPRKATTIGGSGQITVASWIEGDVCITGGTNPAIGNPTTGPAIPVHIGGALFVDGNDWGVGTPTSKVASVRVIGGCWGAHSGWHTLPCDSNAQTQNNGGSGVYATTFSPVEPNPAPSKPVLDAATELALYNSASPGPMHPCGAGSTGSPPANLFDSDSTPNSSLGTKSITTLLGGAAFDCITSSGRLKWTPGGSGGQLHVRGTVFFDASVTFSGGGNYVTLVSADSLPTNGSIYVDGSISFSNSAGLGKDGATWTTSTWDPDNIATDPKLFFAAYNRANSAYGFDLSGNSRFQGIAYTNGGFNLGNSARIAGSILTDFGTINGSGNFKTTLIPASGALGATASVTPVTWSVAPRSWRECPSGVGCT